LIHFFFTVYNDYETFLPTKGERFTASVGPSINVWGNYDWKLVNQAPERRDLSEGDRRKSVGMLLAKHLGEALFLLGIMKISDDIIGEVKAGLKGSTGPRIEF
jgi:hypothetical protein